MKKLLVLFFITLTFASCNKEEEALIETNSGLVQENQELERELALKEQEEALEREKEQEQEQTQEEIDALQAELQANNPGGKFASTSSNVVATEVLNKNGVIVAVEKANDGSSKLFLSQNGKQTLIESLIAGATDFEKQNFANFEFIDGTVLLKYEVQKFEDVEMRFVHTSTFKSLSTGFLSDYGITADKKNFYTCANGQVTSGLLRVYSYASLINEKMHLTRET